LNYQEVLPQLQQLMWDCAGIVRCRDDLVLAGDGIRRLKEQKNGIDKYSVGSISADRNAPGLSGTAVAWSNQLAAAEMIVECAMMRKESRGVHYRSDYPCLDTSLSKSILIRKEQGSDLCRFGWS
jgi:L-aspartate oxidase